jgi:hypothetical protein
MTRPRASAQTFMGRSIHGWPVHGYYVASRAPEKLEQSNLTRPEQIGWARKAPRRWSVRARHRRGKRLQCGSSLTAVRAARSWAKAPRGWASAFARLSPGQRDSARAKIRRANDHIRGLKQSLNRFGQRDRYTVGIEEFKSDVMVPQYQRVIISGRLPGVTPGGLLIPAAAQPTTQSLIRSLTVTITLTPRRKLRPSASDGG